MTFPELLAENIDKDSMYFALNYLDGVKMIEDEIVDTGRWSVFKRAIMEHEGRYWAVEYDEGATEYQDSSGEYSVYEVEPVPVTTIKYRRVT